MPCDICGDPIKPDVDYYGHFECQVWYCEYWCCKACLEKYDPEATGKYLHILNGTHTICNACLLLSKQ
jgi:hypothetical protein